ncbi:NEW3 domain-containing protein [soil metagenome]
MKKNFLRLLLGAAAIFLSLTITDSRSLAGKNDQINTKELAEITIRVASLSNQLSKGKESSFVRNEFGELAKMRFVMLNELAETNPSEVLRVALPKEVLAKIPADLQSDFEKRSDLEGELEVIYECDGESDVLKYFIKTDAERLPVYFAKPPERELLSGSRVRVKGVRVGDAVILESDAESNDFQMLESIAVNTFGEQKVLVLLVNFQNDTRTPFTVAQANELVFNTSNSASVTNFYREASYQQTWLTGDSFGWFTLPINSGDCNGTTTASAARQAASNAGINLSLYNKFVYVYPNMSTCAYSGIAGVGGNEVWINGSLYLRTVAHELGHNFGIYHSRFKDCGTEVIGNTCTFSEYGNVADMMGYSGVTGQFNAFQKERLGWMNYGNSPPIFTVQSSGNYFITANSAQDSSPKALKILRASGEYYYVELRRSIGFDTTLSSTLMNGVVIGLNQPAFGKENYQLDMTPETTYWTDAALPVGRSYTDSGAGFTITPVSADNSGATVNINFGSQPSCIMVNPTISASPTATQWIGAGSAVSYNVTVTNNNNSSCSANTFNLQNSVPSGWSATATSPSLYIAPGASASTTVQVVSPNSAANGFYTVGLGAMNSGNISYANSVAANLAVYSSLGVSVSSDAPSYNSTQTVYLTANVAANGSPLSGANVTFTITRPNGTVAATGTAVSNADGITSFSYRFNRKKDSGGTYQVSANANLNGISGIGTTNFVLVK